MYVQGYYSRGSWESSDVSRVIASDTVGSTRRGEPESARAARYPYVLMLGAWWGLVLNLAILLEG